MSLIKVSYHYSNQLGREGIDVGAHHSEIPTLVNFSGLLLDVSAGSIVLGICFVTRFLERGELDRPDDILDSVEEVRVLLAPPERVNHVFNTDASLLTQQFFDQHVVRNGHSLRVFAFQVASLADHFVEDFLGGLAPGHVILDQQQLLESVC